MKVYLVDFENVKSKGLAGVDKLTEYDRVIIFYSENADTINFEMHQKVMMSKADVEYFKVNVGGKNALDFQLSTLLGYLVATKGYTHLFVISNDKSFDFLHDFWHGKYITSPDCIVYRTRTIAAAINYSGVKKVEEAVDDTAEEDELLRDMLYLQSALTIPQNESSQLAPQEAVSTQQADEAEEAEQSVPVEEKTQEKRAKLDDSELFEYYQQFFNNEKAEVQADDAKSEEEVKADNEKPNEDEPVGNVIGKQEVKPAEKKGSAKPQEASYMKILTGELEGSGCTEDEVKLIGQLLTASETKEEFHNNLAKEFKQQATELYKCLRPKYLRLKEKCAAENAADEAPAADGGQEVSAEEEQTKQAMKSDSNASAQTQAPENNTSDAGNEQEMSAEGEGSAQAEKPEKKTSGRRKKQDISSQGEGSAQAEKPEKKTSGRRKKQDGSSQGEGAAQAEKPEKKTSARRKKQESIPESEAEIQQEETSSETAASPRDRLAQLLDGICTEEELGIIYELFENANTKQQLYIRMVKAFKKDKGCKFYNAIKGEYSAIKK